MEDAFVRYEVVGVIDDEGEYAVVDSLEDVPEEDEEHIAFAVYGRTQQGARVFVADRGTLQLALNLAVQLAGAHASVLNLWKG